MKLKAFSKVILPSGDILLREVVEFDDDDSPLRHYPLVEEIPFVEWHDAVYVYPSSK